MKNAEKKKVIIVGPVYPYNSGIAHYTGLMYRALEKKFDVTMISYKMQYPKLLFKQEQKDYSDKTFQIEGTKYWLHTADPINCIYTAKKINKLKPDMVIFQWQHPYFAPCFWIVTKCLKNTKTLFVCHNVLPHERFPMDKLLTKMTLRHGDRFIVQSSQDEQDLKQIIKKPIYEKAVHPTYEAYKFTGMTQQQARKELTIAEEEKVILFFGLIRKYKGLQYLLKAMPKVQKEVKHVRLLVVGEMREEKNQYMNLIKELEIENVVDLRMEYVPDCEVEKYFMASDVVVLPYVSATQSGIVQIAYGFEKPVIVTNVGGLPEVVSNNRTGYVVESESVEQLADAVIRFFAEDKGAEFSQNVKEEARRFSWDRMTETVERLMV